MLVISIGVIALTPSGPPMTMPLFSQRQARGSDVGPRGRFFVTSGGVQGQGESSRSVEVDCRKKTDMGLKGQSGQGNSVERLISWLSIEGVIMALTPTELYLAEGN